MGLFDDVFKVKLFVDDLKLYTNVYTASDAICLQEHLSFLANWSKTWQLNISTSKWSALHVSTCTEIAAIVYNINDCIITASNAVWDLGVFVDMKLKLHTHIAKIVSKAHQRCNILLRCFLIVLLVYYLKPS